MSIPGILSSRTAFLAEPAASKAAAESKADSGAFAGLLRGAQDKLAALGGQAPSPTSTGNSLAGLSNLSGGSGALKPGVAVEKLRADTESLKAIFRKQMNTLLAENGIDTTQPIRLQSDSFGDVRVANGHPQKDAIEDLFHAHPELRDEFAQISANSSLLRAADTSQAGAAAIPPSEAVPEFNLVLANGLLDIAFV